MFALAYSGGCDSLALALLSHQWLSKSADGGDSGLLAIHVDHNLRAEAAADASEGLRTLEKVCTAVSIVFSLSLMCIVPSSRLLPANSHY